MNDMITPINKTDKEIFEMFNKYKKKKLIENLIEYNEHLNVFYEINIRLNKALHKTFMMLINVCPSDLAGNKELLDVFDIAEKALGFKE